MYLDTSRYLFFDRLESIDNNYNDIMNQIFIISNII